MEHLHRFISIGLGGHFDKREAAGTPRSSILHNIDGDDGPSLSEVVLEVVLGRVVGKVTYK